MSNAGYKEHCEHCTTFGQLLWEESSYVLEVLGWNWSTIVTFRLQTPQITNRKENKSIFPIFMNCEQKPCPQKFKGTTQTCKIEPVLADGEATAEFINQIQNCKKIHLFREMRRRICLICLHYGITDRTGLISTFQRSDPVLKQCSSG